METNKENDGMTLIEREYRCPFCKSQNKVAIKIQSIVVSNGILGPGAKAFVAEPEEKQGFLCKECGIHFSIIEKNKKGQEK